MAFCRRTAYKTSIYAEAFGAGVLFIGNQSAAAFGLQRVLNDGPGDVVAMTQRIIGPAIFRKHGDAVSP